MLSLCALPRPASRSIAVRTLFTSTRIADSVSAHRPWFVSDHKPSQVQQEHIAGPNSASVQLPPQDAPVHLLSLYDKLKTLPYLDPTHLLITKPKEPPISGPSTPFRAPRGRRLRGGTDHGDGFAFPMGTLWDWLLIAQVKEGTEGRGAIYLISKICRENLLTHFPNDPMLLKGISKGSADWAMLDVNQTAIHIVSKAARERWFEHLYQSQSAK
ncbi:hypothetical protein FRC03_005118 [Tulasnella sp. 419]|nr:hypothetical protein FRC03_005118 [Tulasnella sp. 419]